MTLYNILALKKRWHYVNICKDDVMMMSGWKLYVYGTCIDDSYVVSMLCGDIIKRFNLTMKVATQWVVDRNRTKNIAWGCGVIYLDRDVFVSNRLTILIDELSYALRGCKAGKITGAKSINGIIHYRYDLSIPIVSSIGLNYDEYLQNYRGEHGEFNIPNNKDIHL